MIIFIVIVVVVTINTIVFTTIYIYTYPCPCLFLISTSRGQEHTHQGIQWRLNFVARRTWENLASKLEQGVSILPLACSFLFPRRLHEISAVRLKQKTSRWIGALALVLHCQGCRDFSRCIVSLLSESMAFVAASLTVFEFVSQRRELSRVFVRSCSIMYSKRRALR